MSHWLRVLAAGSLVTLAALLACDPSPTSTSPTSTSPTQQAGSNRISGTFLTGTAAAARLTAGSQSTFDGITVSDKRNSNIRVEVSSNGTFTLDHVPGGTVTLVFTRDGTTLGEVTIRGVGSDENIRILLELAANDTVVLIEVQRASEDDTSDDASEDADLELELDPDKWCSRDSNDNSSDDNSEGDDDVVFATIKGNSISNVNLASIRMAGPSGEVSPSSVELKGDRIEVIFDKSVALQVVSGVAEGQRATIQIKGGFQDGTSWQLTESIRIKCDDDDSDDSSSG